MKNLEKILKENLIEYIGLKILSTSGGNCRAAKVIGIILARACRKEIVIITSVKINELLST